MPRPTSSLRVANFLGEDDSVPSTIGDSSAATLENWYKWRKGLRSRGGQAVLGAADQSGSTAIRLLDWVKIGSVERLIAVHDTNVDDWLASTPGSTLSNGAGRLPGSGAADANGAWIEGLYYLGNGIDANLRVNDGTGTADLATQLAFSSSQYLSHATNALLETGDVDFTIAAWVYFDSLSADRPIIAKWDNSTSSQREYRLWYNQAAAKLEFSVWNFTGPFFADALSATVVTTGTWYYVVGWHDSVANTVNIQVNNGAIVSTSYSSGITSNSVDFTVGRLTTGSTYMDGRVQRVGYWKSAGGGGGVLSAGLRTSLYNSGSGKAYASLTAGEKVALISYWDLGASYLDKVVASANDLGSFNAPTTSAGVDYSIIVAEVMPAGPTTNFTLVTSFGGPHPAGDYSYLVSFVTADGIFTTTNPAAQDVTAGGGINISLQSLPLYPAGHDLTGRAIWRKSGGSLFYRLAYIISDNTTTVWIDTVADDDLGETLIETNAAMPPIRYSCEHNSRWIGTGNQSDKATVFISNKFDPGHCPESPDLEDPLQGSRAQLQGRAAGEGLGVCSHGNYVAVFTGGAGYFLTGDEPLDFALTKFCDHGTTAHRTIKSIRGVLIWLAPDGVYAWQNGTATRISDDQRATIEAMTAAEMAGAHAYIFDDKYFLCWATGCIYYDLIYQVWGNNTNWLWQCSTVSTYLTTARQKVYAARVAHARVYQLEVGTTDAIPSAATAIPAHWVSKDWDAGLPSRDKRCHFVESRWKVGTGTATIALLIGSGLSVQSINHDISTVTDVGGTTSVQLTSANDYARSEFFRLDITISATTQVELVAAGIEWTMAT